MFEHPGDVGLLDGNVSCESQHRIIVVVWHKPRHSIRGSRVQQDAKVIEIHNRSKLEWKGPKQTLHIPMRAQAIGDAEESFVTRSEMG